MVLALRDRGWARSLLQWRWEGATLLTAEIAVARYFVRGDPHEILAWCELCELGGARRVEVGTFADVAQAKAACERHARRRLADQPKALAAFERERRGERPQAIDAPELLPVGANQYGDGVREKKTTTNPKSDTATYAIARLRRDRPDIHKRDAAEPPRESSRKPANPGRVQPVLSERERRAFDAAMARLARVPGEE